MPVPRLFAGGLWLAVTATATAMVWAATSIVAADVTDRPAPVVAHSEVVTELASGAPAPPTTRTSLKPVATSTVSTPPRPTTTVPTATRPASPSTTTVPTTPTTASSTPPTTPAVSTTTPGSPDTATYSTAGGVVAVSCSGFYITLVSAIPNNGYGANVVARGPANVDVRFVGPRQELSVKAVCFGHPIRYYTDSLPTP